MKHALRKYLSQRGSALFMVLSLMTALMVLVMAMYFSVVASREVQYKVFYTEQSYRSAVSLSDAIISGLRADKWTDTGSETFKGAIQKMQVGDTISTNGNTFAAFLGTGNEEDDQLGAYTVTISRLADENSVQMYDMAITVSVNGVVDTTHTFFKISVAEYEVEGPNQTFLSTGYAPNDVYVENGTYATDMCFDNPYTVIGGYAGASLYLNGNVISGGSLNLIYHTGTNPIKPLTWAIRDTLYINSTQLLNLGFDADSNGSYSNEERGLVMVGNDYYCQGTVPQNCDIYVNGDLYFLANQDFPDDCKLFVKGNIYLDEDGKIGSLPDFYRCNGTITDKDNNTYPAQKWVGDEVDGNMDVDEMVEKLNGLTSSKTFYKWEINSSKPEDTSTTPPTPRKDYIEALDTRTSASLGSQNALTLYYNNGNTVGPEGTPPKTLVHEIPWEPKTADDYFGEGRDLVYSAHVIKDVVWDIGGSDHTHIALIIDTGDDPNNQHIIKVLPNRDWEGADDKNETFCWNPSIINPGDKPSTCNFTLLIRGRGSVVIDVPEGVTYQDGFRQKVMHGGWFSLLGGTISSTTSQCQDTDGQWKSMTGTSYNANALMSESPSTADQVRSFIHCECDENCTSCHYTVDRNPIHKNPATGKPLYYVTPLQDLSKPPATTENVNANPAYKLCTKERADGTLCGGKIVEITCSRHEYTYSFCEECEYEPERKDENDPDSYYGLCTNRVDRDAVDAKIGSLGEEEKKFLLDSAGNTVYPTVNYFVVSSHESADIRFSGSVDEAGNLTEIQHNMMFGFVYAPYMTYKGYGGLSGAGGKYVRFCGGLIVSDYVLSDDYAMINCFPEYMPTDLLSGENRQNQCTSTTGKDWKISLAAY
ncbi:MAG: hypothetical protein IJZ47_00965 [Oscillospiraceae bacterium]|nr:hypothetical protein [Oscillospiraceae bacterium]